MSVKDLATKNSKDTKKAWPLVRLGDVCESFNGLWKGTKQPLKTVGVIRSTNFTKQCEFDHSKIIFIEVEEKKFLKRKLQCGDIVVERSGGGPNQPVGRVLLFNIEEGDYTISNFTSALRIKDKCALDFSYLHRVLVAQYFSGVTAKMQSNATNIINLHYDEFLNIEFPLPPLTVQREIVARLEKELGEADKLAAKFKRVAELADNAFKAELDETFKALEDNSRRDAETRRVRLGDVCEFVRNGANIKQRKGAAGIPITRIETLSGGVFNSQKVGYADIMNKEPFEKHIVGIGDLLISHINSAQFVGRTVMYRGEINGPIIHGMNLLRARLLDSGKILPAYVELWFKTISARIYISGVTKKSVNQASVNTTDFKRMPIIRPPISTQRAIVAKLDAAKERCEKLKAAAMRGLAAAENLRKAILAEAFEQ